MIYRNKNVGKIDFLSSKPDSTIESQKKNAERVKNTPPTESGTTKSDNSNVINAPKGNGSGILSAGQGNITDFGGSKKQIGCETNNSIWDSSVVQELNESIDNKEKTLQRKAAKEEFRQELKQERMDSMVESIQNTDTRSSASVSNTGSLHGSSYHTPNNSMSIFDDNAFDRVPEKTAGEKAVEEAKEAKNIKDDSWQKAKGTTSSKDIFNSVFDKLTGNKGT